MRTVEAEDLVDGHMAARLYARQNNPEAYRALWNQLEREAVRINAECAARSQQLSFGF